LGRRSAVKQNIDICRTTAFYVPRQAVSGNTVAFPPEEEHHLRDVLRLESDAEVVVLDGCGGRYKVLIEQKSRGGELTGRIVSEERVEVEKPFISVALSLGRRERIRMAVEKLAELGCHRILPLLADNSSFQGNPERLVEKLSLVCRSALKQSGGHFLTAIEKPVTFEQFTALACDGSVQPVFSIKSTRPANRKNKTTSLANSDEYILVIGPEGGFSLREQGLIDQIKAPGLHLGATDLRLETAAVAGLVLLRRLLREDLFFY
jgi:16S rRNA (uracil1498-N3)-methyltransferase